MEVVMHLVHRSLHINYVQYHHTLLMVKQILKKQQHKNVMAIIFIYKTMANSCLTAGM